ncbi:MAG: HD domain-containing protein [Candidatus Thermoplasmatota archaeon]
MIREYEEIWTAAKKELSDSAHGIDHTKRVYSLCRRLADEEVDRDILLPAALLHDIARKEEDEDDTGSVNHAVLGAKKAQNILEGNDHELEKIESIKHCIRTHRFRSDEEPETLEAKILSDADKLDAVGAVGIARAFMLAGRFGERVYREVDRERYAEENLTENGRVRRISKHAPNLEYELKLKEIPEKLYTERAKKIAEDRVEYMESYFSRLKKEIEGER